jgi:Family of unknown function (DUF6352)
MTLDLKPTPLWPACGWQDLERDASGALRATPAWWQRWLERPELLPPEEACPAERALHDRLRNKPMRAVPQPELSAIADGDARENWRHWLRFRDAVEQAGSLQAWYMQLMRSGHIDVPPLFIDHVVQCIVRGLIEGETDAFVVRAAELLFRSQRVSLTDGAVLSGDLETLDMLNETGGFGELGRLLAQAQAPVRRSQIRVLTVQTASEFWASACNTTPRWDWLLDLRHEVTQDLGHGVQFKLTAANSGLKALSRVLERWVEHLLGVRVSIQPESRLEGERWRWHLGLDANATALLNDLYEGHEVDDERRRGLISLFRLHFEDLADLRPELRPGPGSPASAVPVFLGLAMGRDGVLRLKPQNLLLNLPVRAQV